MVSSPLHHTSSLTERLVKLPDLGNADDLNRNNTDKVSSDFVHPDAPAGASYREDVPVESTSCSDLVVRKLLKKNGFVDRSQEKHVAFGLISARSYQVVMGDSLCCSMGCPLTLGWEYSQCPSICVDEYEASRAPRRKREDLRTTWDQRRNMVAESDQEVRRADRKLARERSCQRKVNRRACAAFFSHQDLPEDRKVTAASATPGMQPQARCT